MSQKSIKLKEISAVLYTEGLHVNESKTERYHIQRGGEDAWKNANILDHYLTPKKTSKVKKA